MKNALFLHIQDKGLLFSRHLTESAFSCLVVMTKGKLEAVTLDHWSIALTTGSLTGGVAVIASIPFLRRYLGTRSVAFLGTFFSDVYAHPSHFGGPYSEAFVTAFGAAALSLLLSTTPVEEIQKKIMSKIEN